MAADDIESEAGLPFLRNPGSLSPDLVIRRDLAQ